MLHGNFGLAIDQSNSLKLSLYVCGHKIIVLMTEAGSFGELVVQRTIGLMAY